MRMACLLYTESSDSQILFTLLKHSLFIHPLFMGPYIWHIPPIQDTNNFHLTLELVSSSCSFLGFQRQAYFPRFIVKSVHLNPPNFIPVSVEN